jgi:hypothetical protein
VPSGAGTDPDGSTAASAKILIDLAERMGIPADAAIRQVGEIIAEVDGWRHRAVPDGRGQKAPPEAIIHVMQLVKGRYKCSWCGADLNLPFDDRSTVELISVHGETDIQIIEVDGEEHHRCERPGAST